MRRVYLPCCLACCVSLRTSKHDQRAQPASKAQMFRWLRDAGTMQTSRHRMQAMSPSLTLPLVCRYTGTLSSPIIKCTGTLPGLIHSSTFSGGFAAEFWNHRLPMRRILARSLRVLHCTSSARIGWEHQGIGLVGACVTSQRGRSSWRALAEQHCVTGSCRTTVYGSRR